MRLLLLLCVPAILITSGNGLKCDTCYVSKGALTDCTGIRYQCRVNELCLAIIMTTTLITDGQISHVNESSIRRQCGKCAACERSGKISSPSYKMTFSISCCSIEDCTVSLPELPPENNTFNGLVCPAASSKLKPENKPSYAMKCTGDEEYCFEFTYKSLSLEYVTGCASITYCVAADVFKELYSNHLDPLRPKISCKKANKTSSLPVVNTLLCQQCRGSTDFKCEQYSRCSPENDACVTIILKTAYGGKKNTQMIKRCGFSSECNIAGIISSTQKIISKNTSCCYTDNCISPIPTFPSESNETNGHVCESCYIKEYGSCTGRDHIACTGNETQCISYTEKVIDGVFTSKEILHGCAHPSICDSGNVTVTYDHMTLQETKICSIPAKSSVHLPNILCAYFMFIIWSNSM